MAFALLKMGTRKDQILVTGITGYVGGRLVPKLLEAGFNVRILIRDPAHLSGRNWRDQVEVYHGNIMNPETYKLSLNGIDVVYYMISHDKSTYQNGQKEIEAAREFSAAAQKAGVQRIIYLGGIELKSGQEETHQHSRMLLGDALRESGIQVIELRASVIIGSGSLFFELIRNLVEKIPVLLPPKSFSVTLHPISIQDVLEYLVRSIEIKFPACITVDIGTSNAYNLCEMLLIYAKVRELRRWIKLVPAIPDWVASFWINFVTPVPIEIAGPIIKEVQEEKIVSDQRAKQYFPDIVPVSYEEAVRRSIQLLEEGNIETSWSDSISTTLGGQELVDKLNSEGLVFEYRQLVSPAPPGDVFNVIKRLGGAEGWLFFDWAWRMRGFMDRVTGGVGIQRGRRNPNDLRVGDALDCWRVESIIPDRFLRLRAEMKVPGEAWLEFEIEPVNGSKTRISQVALFSPRGLTGLAYWYMLFPIHKILFSGLIRKISEKSVARAIEY